MKEIVISAEGLGLKELQSVLLEREVKLRLSTEVVERVKKNRNHLESLIAEGRTIYGVTTGFGRLSEVLIPKEDVKALQRNLLLSHSCGVGEPLPESISKLAMLLRINTLAKGFSGVRYELLERMVDMFNEGIVPVIPEKGSVGASGDLAPLAHMGLAVIGEGDVFFKGKKVRASEAFKEVGLSPYFELEAKEGIAIINGTPVMAAIGVDAFLRGKKLLKVADIAAAMSLEAMEGVPYAFDPRLQDIRGFEGQKVVASNVLRLIEGSDIVYRNGHMRIQDAYSLRCVPQVHGAVRDTLKHVGSVLEVEVNAVTDNPVFLEDEPNIISGGNFHGEPLGMVMDFLSIALSELGNISERRVARLVDSNLSGLPSFLVMKSGLNSGMMIPQYVAAALVSENKTLCMPAVVDSIPTSANQEDHVSMGTIAARKARSVSINVSYILAIELMVASQGLEFRKRKMGVGTGIAYRQIRQHVAPLDKDRYMKIDIEIIREMVESNFTQKIEEKVGGL
ncbi:MAG: histidine ammonia-lyase [Synergistetes bacterium]|nr:histidine ammonia-lyase [Synergistota bacterium]